MVMHVNIPWKSGNAAYVRGIIEGVYMTSFKKREEYRVNRQRHSYYAGHI